MPTTPTGAAGAEGAALGVGAQPAAAQPKDGGMYEKVPFTGGARDTAHLSYGQVHHFYDNTGNDVPDYLTAFVDVCTCL